jgi:uncharacterized protein GlcG (DUF336 family)
MLNRSIALFLGFTFSAHAFAADKRHKDCQTLPDHKTLQSALEKIVQEDNAGIFKPNAMWATVVARSGVVCSVAKTGDAWPGSRVISAQKASTANSFSNKLLSLSTANLYAATQPGGPLYGLQHSNPVNTDIAYRGDSKFYGTAQDPLEGGKIGGVNVFGGGLALYASSDKVLGGLGVSGDTACADHIIAWKIRNLLKLDAIPGGVSAGKDDNMIHDLDPATGKSAGGFGHPVCSPESKTVAEGLKVSRK